MVNVTFFVAMTVPTHKLAKINLHKHAVIIMTVSHGVFLLFIYNLAS